MKTVTQNKMSLSLACTVSKHEISIHRTGNFTLFGKYATNYNSGNCFAVLLSSSFSFDLFEFAVSLFSFEFFNCQVFL